jgi:hypothetical protein
MRLFYYHDAKKNTFGAETNKIGTERDFFI